MAANSKNGVRSHNKLLMASNSKSGIWNQRYERHFGKNGKKEEFAKSTKFRQELNWRQCTIYALEGSMLYHYTKHDLIHGKELQSIK